VRWFSNHLLTLGVDASIALGNDVNQRLLSAVDSGFNNSQMQRTRGNGYAGRESMSAELISSKMDQRAFRRALGNFVTGVTIVTAKGSDGEVGVTASSFNSLSLDPPLILWSCAKNSLSCVTFEQASHFAVNILAAEQKDLSNRFSRQQRDKFEKVTWTPGLGGAPLFPNCAGIFQCESYQKHDGGDHWIFVGKVVEFDDFGRAPLGFHQGAYSVVMAHPDSAVRSETASGLTEPKSARVRNHTFFLMLKAVRSYQAKYKPKQEALGLSLLEARALLFLSDHPGFDCGMLVEYLSAPINTVSEVMDSVLERGLAIEGENGFELTERGEERARQSWLLAEQHAEETFSQFSDSQIETFKEVLRELAMQ